MFFMSSTTQQYVASNVKGCGITSSNANGCPHVQYGHCISMEGGAKQYYPHRFYPYHIIIGSYSALVSFPLYSATHNLHAPIRHILSQNFFPLSLTFQLRLSLAHHVFFLLGRAV
jgi:hypothetical protein